MDYALKCLPLDLDGNQTLSAVTAGLARREARRMAAIFYIVDPSEYAFEKWSDVPDYYGKLAPSIAMLMFTEVVARALSTKMHSYRVNDFLTSFGSLTMYMAAGAPIQAIELLLYEAVYRWRLFTFDWSSLWTWCIGAIAVDFLFYWFHKFCHETHIGWAGHQVHHSSEEYNLVASLRQSVTLKAYTIVFYFPLAYFGVPITTTLVHMQLNVIFQLWLHTELITTLGPLEYIFNTPSHHRVHHGSEPWCLDKNYGGVLIIWDKMFGTFQPEIKDKKIIYGLVDQPQSMNVIYIETFYYKHVYDKFMEQTTWGGRFKSIFYGPGWTPGSPRLGLPLPDPPADQRARKKYDPQLPRLLEAYLVVHFFLATFAQEAVWKRFYTMSPVAVVFNTIYSLSTLATIGGIYDGWTNAIRLESIRCVAYFMFSIFYPVFDNMFVNRLMQIYFAASILVWSAQSVRKNQKMLDWNRKFL